MKKAALCTIVPAFLTLMWMAPKTADAQLTAGAAKVDVTPARMTGINLAGYAPRKSDGVHDPLTARCVVLDDGATRMAVVTLDLIGLFYDDILKISEDGATAAAIPRENILVHSIHTHSGPDTMGLWGGTAKSYKDSLRQGATDCLKEAAGHMIPVSAFVASAEVNDININRRHPKDKQPDRTLAALELRDSDGKAVCILVNFALHPVVLGVDNLKMTADYVFYVREKLEKDLGGTALMVTRDIGDANPPALAEDVYERKGGTFDQAQRIGERLAAEAEKTLKSAKETPFHIRIVRREVDLPVKNPQFLGLMRGGVIKRKLVNGASRTDVAVVDLGQAQIITFPGEATSEVGSQAAALLPGPVKFLFGQTFDEIAYLLMQDEWDEGRYEESMSLGKGTAELLLATYSEMLKDWTR